MAGEVVDEHRKAVWDGPHGPARWDLRAVGYSGDAGQVGNWEVVFTYTAASPSRVSIAHNKFKEADETKQTGQSRIGDFDLPAGSNVAKAVRFTIPTSPDPLWTPQFQMPTGSPDVTFHKIEVHEYTPDPNAEPPAKTGGVEVHGEGSAQVWVHEAPQDIPAQMRAMPSGYPSIDAMVAQKGFLVAHRGGSASWPEMSMRRLHELCRARGGRLRGVHWAHQRRRVGAGPRSEPQAR